MRKSMTTLMAAVMGADSSAPFLILDGTETRITYGELGSWSLRYLHWLRAKGVRAGDRVACVVNHGYDLYALLIASSLNGNSLIPLSGEMHPDKLAVILTDAAPQLVLFEAGCAPIPAQFATEPMPARETLPEVEPEVSSWTGDPDAPLLIIYTSGTTGKPKGVILSEKSITLMAANIGGFYGISAADRLYCVMPLSHMNGLMITGFVPMLVGASVVVGSRFRFNSAKYYLSRIEANAVTVLSIIPSIMAVLMQLFPNRPDLRARGVRMALCGTAPLSEPLWRSFEEHFHIPVYQGYGLTETSCWATMSPLDGKRYDTVGVPVNCDVRIDSADPTQPGEVLIGGEILMQGYVGQAPRRTGEFFRSGDIGYFDDVGQLVISGRIKDIIIRNGLNMHPMEIDGVLVGHPSVAEAATVGIANEIVGEEIHTAWTLADGAAAPADRELRDWLGARVSESSLPNRLHALGALPKNAVGKVDRNILRRILDGSQAVATLEAINTRKWLRQHVETNRGPVYNNVQQALRAGTPLKFFKYWGAAAKDALDEIDTAALKRLMTMLGILNDQHPFGVSLTLLFMDTHYLGINGFDRARTERYTAAVNEYITRHGYQTMHASALWREGGLTHEMVRASAARPEFDAYWRHLAVREQLIMQAGKHGQHGVPEQLARTYCCANLMERELYAQRFAGSIFLTFSKESEEQLLPDLPKLYLFSHRKGASEKPWFVAAADVRVAAGGEA